MHNISRREIDPATIGQCTGLRDKSGALIFEGDVVKYPEHYEDACSDVRWGFCAYVITHEDEVSILDEI